MWKKGVIYDASDVKISINENGISCFSNPVAEKYYMFGVSPEIILSGHKNHLDDFNFLNFSLSATENTQFLGIVFRSISGDVYRLKLHNGNDVVDSLNISSEGIIISNNLKERYCEDYSMITFNDELKKQIVQVEFLFRCKKRNNSIYSKSFIIRYEQIRKNNSRKKRDAKNGYCFAKKQLNMLKYISKDVFNKIYNQVLKL